MLSPSKRWKHFAAMVLIGDGVMALVHPQHDTDAWNAGPHWWCHLMRSLHDRPTLTRAIGIAQIAGGVCWALSPGKQRTCPRRSVGSSSVPSPRISSPQNKKEGLAPSIF